MCDPFVCFERVRFFSWELPPDFGYIFILLVVTFGLQWLANIVWTANAQNTRNLFQEPIDKRGTIFTGLLGRSMAYTFLATLLWILRITLILESNLWIYIMVLLGNMVGVYWTESRTKADHQNTADSLTAMLKRLNNEECNEKCVKGPIREALRLLKRELAKVDDEESELTPLIKNTNLKFY